MGLEDKLTREQETTLRLIEKAGLSNKELSLLLNSPKRDNFNKIYKHELGRHVKIGVLSDTHIGHEKFDENFLKFAAETFRREGVTNVYHVGDILEGMSGRDGHIFELSQVGFQQQMNYAERLFRDYFKGMQIYAITGNHDDWYIKKANLGVNIGEELEKRSSNFHYLGDNEADVQFAPNCKMKLFHANDGTAYATSYKLQKLIESFGGAEKPNIVVSGHYHKALYMFCRNVHGLESGTMCNQTQYMRGKKIPANKGFWILEFEIGKRGITKFLPIFYPAYD